MRWPYNKNNPSFVAQILNLLSSIYNMIISLTSNNKFTSQGKCLFLSILVDIFKFIFQYITQNNFSDIVNFVTLSDTFLFYLKFIQDLKV